METPRRFLVPPSIFRRMAMNSRGTSPTAASEEASNSLEIGAHGPSASSPKIVNKPGKLLPFSCTVYRHFKLCILCAPLETVLINCTPLFGHNIRIIKHALT